MIESLNQMKPLLVFCEWISFKKVMNFISNKKLCKYSDIRVKGSDAKLFNTILKMI